MLATRFACTGVYDAIAVLLACVVLINSKRAVELFTKQSRTGSFKLSFRRRRIAKVPSYHFKIGFVFTVYRAVSFFFAIIRLLCSWV